MTEREREHAVERLNRLEDVRMKHRQQVHPRFPFSYGPPIEGCPVCKEIERRIKEAR